MIVVEARKCDEPEIAENHSVKIKSEKIAEAESTEYERHGNCCEQRNTERSREKMRPVEHDDFETRVECRYEDQRQAAHDDVETQQDG